MPPLEDYLALIPPMNAGKPDFIAGLTADLEPMIAVQNLIASLPDAFDLDTAIGAQLDAVGIWIGRNRNIDVPITNVYFSWDIDGLGWEQG